MQVCCFNDLSVLNFTTSAALQCSNKISKRFELCWVKMGFLLFQLFLWFNDKQEILRSLLSLVAPPAGKEYF